MVDALHETTVSESEVRSKVRIWIRDRRRAQTFQFPASAWESSSIVAHQCRADPQTAVESRTLLGVNAVLRVPRASGLVCQLGVGSDRNRMLLS
jgi:hypothetical protein